MRPGAEAEASAEAEADVHAEPEVVAEAEAEVEVVAEVEGEAEAIDFGPFDKERAELEAFAAAITDGAPYPLPASDAIHGIEVFEAIIESAETGETVAVG